ncbi:unnamed protein product [Pleuronectes platessa]|uniref:Uncharacterized protein n=1 Tax=Pleuronectes platessa TaxID=8262 RepID=A0A9N7Y5B3_PLEPL|nr:unnamed protein product [Pleuronectes platessa]
MKTFQVNTARHGETGGINLQMFSGVQLLPVGSFTETFQLRAVCSAATEATAPLEPEEDKQLQTTSHLKNTPEVAAGLLRVKRCFNLAAGPSASLQSAGAFLIMPGDV